MDLRLSLIRAFLLARWEHFVDRRAKRPSVVSLTKSYLS